MQKDKGTIHKLFALILLLWGIVCWGVLWTIMKAGYTNRHIEDCLTQANLAALIVDPYHYGATGELVFENADKIKDIFEEVLYEGLGNTETKKNLGIKDAELLDFRIYEVTSKEISEIIFDRYDNCNIVRHAKGGEVRAPDGTSIESSAIYARIAVPTEFLFGVEVTAIKEHCVDIVSEEVWNEQK